MSADPPVTCAAPGCQNPIARKGRGRPAVYCSPACRPAARGHRPVRVLVEVDHEPTPDDLRPAGRIWLVRLRRGDQRVVIAAELGRPSAEHLAAQLTALLSPRRTKGAPID
jgi:hypothetical protein